MSVYFATSGPYVKVGYSVDPFSRVGSITRNGTRPDDLPALSEARLIGWIPGDVHREMAMLVRFAKHRVAGEWFSGDILTEVRDVIWEDPSGVDLDRMSAMAVLAADRNRDATRAEIEAAGVRIEAVDEATIFATSNWLKRAAS